MKKNKTVVTTYLTSSCMYIFIVVFVIGPSTFYTISTTKLSSLSSVNTEVTSTMFTGK